MKRVYMKLNHLKLMPLSMLAIKIIQEHNKRSILCPLYYIIKVFYQDVTNVWRRIESSDNVSDSDRHLSRECLFTLDISGNSNKIPWFCRTLQGIRIFDENVYCKNMNRIQIIVYLLIILFMWNIFFIYLWVPLFVTPFATKKQ